MSNTRQDWSSSKHFLTSILLSLQSIKPPDPVPTSHEQQQATSTSTSTASAPSHDHILQTLSEADQKSAKNVLLTLHFLFPHELLPALDLIDRRLITHLSCSTSSAQSTTDQPSPPGSKPQHEIYYVQSASTQSNAQPSNQGKSSTGRFRNALQKPHAFYEVDLHAWNCNCPAFAFASLKQLMRDTSVTDHDEVLGPQGEEGWEWLVGGVATRSDAAVPVCKHILAVALTRAAEGLFGHGVVRREVALEELAGWAAGWGEY